MLNQLYSSPDQHLDPGTHSEAASSWRTTWGWVSLSVTLHCTDLLKDFAGLLKCQSGCKWGVNCLLVYMCSQSRRFVSHWRPLYSRPGFRSFQNFMAVVYNLPWLDSWSIVPTNKLITKFGLCDRGANFWNSFGIEWMSAARLSILEPACTRERGWSEHLDRNHGWSFLHKQC